jgi:hypothetical protein
VSWFLTLKQKMEISRGTEMVAFITAPSFYVKNEKQITQWLDEHDCVVTGAFITFPSEEILTLFVLCCG